MSQDEEKFELINKLCDGTMDILPRITLELQVMCEEALGKNQAAIATGFLVAELMLKVLVKRINELEDGPTIAKAILRAKQSIDFEVT